MSGLPQRKERRRKKKKENLKLVPQSRYLWLQSSIEINTSKIKLDILATNIPVFA